MGAVAEARLSFFLLFTGTGHYLLEILNASTTFETRGKCCICEEILRGEREEKPPVIAPIYHTGVSALLTPSSAAVNPGCGQSWLEQGWAVPFVFPSFTLCSDTCYFFQRQARWKQSPINFDHGLCSEMGWKWEDCGQEGDLPVCTNTCGNAHTHVHMPFLPKLVLLLPVAQPPQLSINQTCCKAPCNARGFPIKFDEH